MTKACMAPKGKYLLTSGLISWCFRGQQEEEKENKEKYPTPNFFIKVVNRLSITIDFHAQEWPKGRQAIQKELASFRFFQILNLL